MQNCIKPNKFILDVLLKNVQSPIKEQSQSQILRELSFDVLTPDQRLRLKGTPVGLKNLANVCYLNSLIQTYFHNPIFVKEILSFKYPIQLNFEDLLNKNEAKAKRIKSSIDLVVHLQRLFAYLVHTHRKYVLFKSEFSCSILNQSYLDFCNSSSLNFNYSQSFEVV